MADPLLRLLQAIEVAQPRQVPVIEVSSSNGEDMSDSSVVSPPQSKDIYMASPIRTPRSVTDDIARKTPQQAAAAVIQAGEGVMLYRSAVARAGAYLPPQSVAKPSDQRRAATLAEAINASLTNSVAGVLPSVTVPDSVIIIDPESPGVKALPKRQREALVSAYHNTTEDVAKRYSAVLANRVTFVKTAAWHSRFGNPFDPTQYPNKPPKGQRDPFSEFAKATAPRWTDTVVYTQEAFANNVPYKLSAAALAAIGSAYERGIENQNIGEFVRGLLELGFQDNISSREDEVILSDPSKVSRFIDYTRAATQFLSEDERLLQFTAFVGVFPFQLPLNDPTRFGALRGSAVDALAGHFVDQENDAAFVDMYRTTLVKSFFNMKRFQSLAHLKRDAFTFTEECPLFSKYSHIKIISAGSYGFVLRVMPRELHRPNGNVKRAENADPDSDDIEEQRAVRSIVDGAEKSERLLLESAPLFAVKIQAVGSSSRSLRTTGTREPGDPINTDDTAFTELMVLQTIKQKTNHWRAKHRASNIFNHVRLFDFVRCAFNPREVFTPLLREDDPTRFSNKTLPDRYDEWQIMVLEYADSGTLDSFLVSRNPKNTLAMAKWDAFASVTIQILGHIESLREAQYTHHDVKTLNILLSAVSPRRKCSYFAYKDVALDAYSGGKRNTLYVPVWGMGYVAKLSDTGFSAITGTATLPNGKTVTHYIPSKSDRAHRSGHKYNPAIDVELYGYTFLRSLLQGFAEIGYSLEQTCKAVDWRIFQWIKTYCRQNPYASVSTNAEHVVYNTVDDFLADAYKYSRSARPGDAFPSRWILSDIRGLLDSIYSAYSVKWHGVVPEGSQSLIARALAYEGFRDFTHAPDSNNYTEANGAILVMTDYHD